MEGKILKGIGGFYYVHGEDGEVYACRAKGIFRKEKIKPLVGDNVEITVLDVQDKEGSLVRIFPRKNQLYRPTAANVDQAVVIFAAASPKPNLNLLDRFLIAMEQQRIPVIICINKADLAEQGELDRIGEIYRDCGSRILFLSVAKMQGTDQIRPLLAGKTTIVAGPSGVGKSSLTNLLQSGVQMEVGEVSRKIDRGRHTTRHTQLITIGEDTYFLDTPGFSSLYLDGIEYEQVKEYFHEFSPYEGTCRFQGCLHLQEPDCQVKRAVREGKIHPDRYESYVMIAEERKKQKKNYGPRREQ